MNKGVRKRERHRILFQIIECEKKKKEKKNLNNMYLCIRALAKLAMALTLLVVIVLCVRIYLNDLLYSIGGGSLLKHTLTISTVKMKNLSLTMAV